MEKIQRRGLILMCTALTFNELERKSQSTKGWTLVAKNARNAVIGIATTLVVSKTLDRLVTALTPERLASLSPKNKAELTADLQELHALLVVGCRQSEREQSRAFRLLMSKIEERTEDLGDIIEDLVLSGDEQFKMLLSDCVKSISAPVISELVGRMEGRLDGQPTV